MAETTPVLTEVGKSIEGAIDGLRWCRQHIQERGVTMKLRELEQTIGALALSLDYEMDGQSGQAGIALEHADWRPQSVARTYRDMVVRFGTPGDLSMSDH